jgi:hypothetical protein
MLLALSLEVQCNQVDDERPQHLVGFEFRE